jgi:hypothetical protein
MKRLWAIPRVRRVLLASVALWLLLGWFWGDDPLWTVVRALALPIFILMIVASLAWTNAVVRGARVTLGALLGGYCAYVLGGATVAVLATATVFAAFLAGCEYLMWRDARHEAGGSRTPPAA